MIPDYDVVVIDEAHELVARVTQAATDELSAAEVDRARRAAPATRRGQRGRRPRRRRRRAARRHRRARRPAASTRCPTSSATPWCSVRDAAPGLPVGLSQGRPRSGRRRRPHPGQGDGAGGVRHRRADGGQLGDATSVGDRGLRRSPRLTCAWPRSQVWRADARQAADRQAVVFTRATLQARRRLQRRGLELGLKPSETVDGRPTWSAAMTCCRGAASTSAARSTTASRGSSTSPATCRRPAATGSARPSSTRSSSWSTPPRVARWGSSPAGAPPRPPPRRSASGCRT